MSTDWEKYSNAAETQGRGRVPADNGVVSFGVGPVRSIPQVVEHSPAHDNRAHSDVLGEKTPEVRLLLRRLALWKIRVPPGR